MTDDVQRRLADIEKRLARLEKLTEKPAVTYADIAQTYRQSSIGKPLFEEQTDVSQFCPCGKDRLLCRAPDCPTHRKDGA